MKKKERMEGEPTHIIFNRFVYIVYINKLKQYREKGKDRTLVYRYFLAYGEIILLNVTTKDDVVHC